MSRPDTSKQVADPAADRKRQLVHAAADLFAHRGYAAVTVQQIAEIAGISAGAVYRHVGSKEALLDDVLVEATSTFLDAITPAEAAGARALVHRAIHTATRQPDLVGAYVRQRNRLEAVVPQLAADETELAGVWRRTIAALQPRLDEAALTTRGHAVVGVLTAIADSTARSSSARLAAVGDGIEAIMRSPMPRERTTIVRSAPPWSPPVSRRQQIVDAAIELFGERSYDRVSLADVGLRAGVAAPTMYEYFATKVDILLAAYELGGALLTTLRLSAVHGAAGPDDALARIATGLTELCFDNQALITVNSRAWFWIPPEEQPRFATSRDELDELWSAVLRECVPALAGPDARFITNCTSWLIVHVARSTTDDPARRRQVAALALAFMRTAADAAVR